MLSARSWNNGNLELSPKMKRICVTHRHVVDEEPTRIFVRACPAVVRGNGGLGLVEAPGVLDGSALPELLQRPELEALAYVTLRDVRRRRLHVFLAAGELVAGKLEIEARDREGGGAAVQTSLTLTALSEPGNALFDDQLGARMGSALQQVVETLCGGDNGEAPPRPASVTRSVRVSHEIAVEGDADACFALACPVAELRWLDGWSFDLLYSESGRNEDGCIFREPLSGLGVLRSPGADTIWYTTLHDEAARRFHAVLLTPDLMIARFSCEVDDLGDGRALMRWELTHSGLNDQGNAIVAEVGFWERPLGMLQLLARSAKHYLETGEMYRMPAALRARLALSVISAAVGRHVRRTWRRVH